MKKDRTCKHCKITIENVHGREFANHVRWCDENPNRRKGLDKIAKATKERCVREFGEYKKYNVTCRTCEKKFTVEERAKNFPSKDQYHCSYSCANRGRVYSEETRRKVRAKLKKTRICDWCNVEFSPLTVSKFCSGKCKKEKSLERSASRLRNGITIEDYRVCCKFGFSLRDYPEDFDFGLIERYGWYSPSNSKIPNLEGVSRDHIVSVCYGFENKIDPKIIAHPANCQLLVHTENISKNDKCHMTLDELLKRIETWDK